MHFYARLKYAFKKTLVADIEEYAVYDILRQVRIGKANLGILSMFSGSEQITLNKINNGNLIFTRLMDRQLYAVVGKKNPFFIQIRQRYQLKS